MGTDESLDLSIQMADIKLPPLPPLRASPAVHPGCCLALSAPLLENLANLLPSSPFIVLSIGSGYGLLESYLLSQPHNIRIIGVEVQPTSNRHLPPSHHHCVTGSRFLDPLAGEAKVWMFVYPKRVGLVDEYIEAYGRAGVEKIIWAGPKADWEDYKGCFEGVRDGRAWDVVVKSADEIGGTAWEMLAVATKEDG